MEGESEEDIERGEGERTKRVWGSSGFFLQEDWSLSSWFAFPVDKATEPTIKKMALNAKEFSKVIHCLNWQWAMKKCSWSLC